MNTVSEAESEANERAHDVAIEFLQKLPNRTNLQLTLAATQEFSFIFRSWLLVYERNPSGVQRAEEAAYDLSIAWTISCYLEGSLADRELAKEVEASALRLQSIYGEMCHRLAHLPLYNGRSSLEGLVHGAVSKFFTPSSKPSVKHHSSSFYAGGYYQTIINATKAYMNELLLEDINFTTAIRQGRGLSSLILRGRGFLPAVSLLQLPFQQMQVIANYFSALMELYLIWFQERVTNSTLGRYEVEINRSAWRTQKALQAQRMNSRSLLALKRWIENSVDPLEGGIIQKGDAEGDSIPHEDAMARQANFKKPVDWSGVEVESPTLINIHGEEQEQHRSYRLVTKQRLNLKAKDVIKEFGEVSRRLFGWFVSAAVTELLTLVSAHTKLDEATILSKLASMVEEKSGRTFTEAMLIDRLDQTHLEILQRKPTWTTRKLCYILRGRTIERGGGVKLWGSGSDSGRVSSGRPTADEQDDLNPLGKALFAAWSKSVGGYAK